MDLFVVPVVVLIAAGAVWLRTSGAGRARAVAPAAQTTDPEAAATPCEAPVPYTTAAIDAVRDECFKLAFGVPQFDYQLLGEHLTVYERAEAQLQTFKPEQSYFPRRPMLLPRLLQALNSEDSTRASLTQMILQDPALAGGVLEKANTAWYRTTPKPVESIDRALAMLGTEGLRSIVATFILQPLFRLPSGYFDRFAAITWEQGQRAGFAAQVLAQRTGSCDPLVAQLLALLSALSRIVLFRFTSECYRESPNVLPRAEVFIRLMQQHGAKLSATIAAEWELSRASIDALEEQAHQSSPAIMSPIGRTLYFAELAGALAAAKERGRYSEEGALSILRAQGLSEYDLNAAWQAAQTSLSRAEG